MKLGERFWDKVQVVGDCMEWVGYVTWKGYGQFSVGTKMRASHRLAWEEANGPIPEGMQLDHLCRNRRCVDPLHLEVVTREENNRRGLCGFARTHCKHGHELTSANLFRHARRRLCKECQRQRTAKYKARLADGS